MYAKLFASLYQGTLRGCSDPILVFTNLLAHANASGEVDRHFRAIADETGLPEDRVRAAITFLESPDPESRSPDANGCRIIKLDEHRLWGWIIVNHGKYRAIRSEDERREQNRIAQEKWRAKNKQENKQSKPDKPESAHTEAEAEASNSKAMSFNLDGNPQKDKNKEAIESAKRILQFLNQKTGRAYRPVDVNLSMIAARIKEGATEDNCRQVIAKKAREWTGDEKMSPYLRPATLFNKTKFNQYIGELVNHGD